MLAKMRKISGPRTNAKAPMKKECKNLSITLPSQPLLSPQCCEANVA